MSEVLSWTCKPCKKTFTSLYPAQLESVKRFHEGSKKHLRRVERLEGDKRA